MATTYSVEAIGRNASCIIVTWGPLASGESGDEFVRPQLTDATIHVYGTFSGGATLELQGSNDTTAGTSNWAPLSEPDGSVFSGKTDIDIAQILESPFKFRPVITGGDGSTAITVKFKMVSNQELTINPQLIKNL